MLKSDTTNYQPKFVSMKKFSDLGSYSNNKRKYFINVFKAWLNIVIDKKYTLLEDINHNEIFGDLNQTILNSNQQE